MNLKKRKLALTLALILLFVNAISVSAAVPKIIRIGLSSKYKEVSSISISNKTVKVGYEVNDSFVLQATIESQNGLSAIPSNFYYVKTKETYASFEQASAKAKTLKTATQNALAAFLGANNWQVYYGGFATYKEAENTAIATGGTVVNPSSIAVALVDGKGVHLIVFASANNFIQVGATGNEFIGISDRKYRGVIEFGRYKKDKLTAVNVITPDEYLYSTVQSEMPHTWHLEALKAQAVAARNYLLTRMGAHSSEGYELCDTVHCQNYLGESNEASETTRAVKETENILIYYDSKPINAVYFSSSGGYTYNSEDVWANKIPYLRAVKEVAEKTYREWTRTFTLAEITNLLKQNNYNIGNAISVSIAKLPDGRILQLIINGEKNKVVLEKESIRTFFSKSKDGSLISRTFTIQNAQNSKTSQLNELNEITNEIVEQYTNYNIDHDEIIISPNDSKGEKESSSQTTTTPLKKTEVAVLAHNGIHSSKSVEDGLTVVNSHGEKTTLTGIYVLGKNSVAMYNLSDEPKTPSSSPSDEHLNPDTSNNEDENIGNNTNTEKPPTNPPITNTPIPNGQTTILTSSGNSVTFVGKGFGHGVGMSQYGAKGMAEAGYTFKQILEFYYTGAVVK